MDEFAKYFREVKEAGLGVTLHIAEVRHRLYILNHCSCCVHLDCGKSIRGDSTSAILRA